MSEVETTHVRNLARFSGLLLALGSLAVVIALWLSYTQLRNLQTEINRLASEATRLENQTKNMETEAARLKERNDKLRANAKAMRDEITGLREALSASRFAIIAFHQREYSAAVDWYNKALDADPNNAYLLNLKAYSLFKLGETSQAIKVQKASIQADPEYAWGYFDLARFMCKVSDFGAARRAMEVALEKRPSLRGIMEKDGEFQRLCSPLFK